MVVRQVITEKQIANLKPFDGNRSREEAQKNGRKGGIASGEARRKKAAAKKAFSEVLGIVPNFDPNNVKDAKTIQILKKYGIGEDDLKNVDLQLLAALALANKAVSGNTGAIRLIMEIVGEDAASQMHKQKMAAERKRLQIERERLELERQRLELERARLGGDQSEDVPVIVDVRPDDE